MSGQAESIHFGCSQGDLAVLALRRDADRLALVVGDARYTYRQVSHKISQVIQVLKSHGLGRGDGLAMLSVNRPEVVFVSLAVNIMGVRYTPLHPLGSEADHKYTLENSEVTALVVDNGTFADRGRTIAGSLSNLKGVFTFGPADFGIDLIREMAGRSPQPLVVESRAQDICNVSFTGGTTGQPKGVVLSHRSFVAARLASLSAVDWPKEVRFLATAPLSHASGTLIIPVLLKGGTLYFQPGFQPEPFLAAVKRERITFVFAVPAMINALLDHSGIADADVSSIHTFGYGAAPIAPARLKQALEVFGPVFQQGYGLTEVPQPVCMLRRQDHDIERLDRLASCGTPVAGLQVKIFDENHQEVTPGVIGEICVRGAQVMEGYWKRPTETEEAFRGGWLHTGDMAHRDEDGFITIVDRANEKIVLPTGTNVFPSVVENLLAEHPAISMCAVIGVNEGSSGEMVKAVVVLKPGVQARPEELMAFVRKWKGESYVPKRIEFVDSLPLSPLGKVDKKKLRAASN